MQWKNNEFEVAGFSQEVFGELRATRKLSSSSDTKYSSRFYKTALAWFQPFVQTLLDFESNGDCLSHVIEYLHHLAGKYHHYLLGSTCAAIGQFSGLYSTVRPAKSKTLFLHALFQD